MFKERICRNNMEMESQRKRSKNTWGKCAKEVKFTKKVRKGEGRTAKQD